MTERQHPDEGWIYRSGLIGEAMERLQHHGIIFGDGYHSVSDAAGNILVAEAVNWAAKEIDYDFYDIKPAVIVAAAVEGKKAGVILHQTFDEWGESVYELYHPQVGVACFHDPYGKIRTLVKECEEKVNLVENCFPRSRVPGQSYAFDLLTDERLVKDMARRTPPEWSAVPASGFTAREKARGDKGGSYLRHSTASEGWSDRNPPRIVYGKGRETGFHSR